MNKFKLLLLLVLMILLETSCFKKADDTKNKAVYVDKDGITRVDPMKIKVGDVINGWKVTKIDIKKFSDPEEDKKTYYPFNKKEDQRDFSAEIEFEGNFQFNGEYMIEERQFLDNFIVVDIPNKKDNLNFPKLNYNKGGDHFFIYLRIDNYNDVYQKLKAKKYIVGSSGKATFIIDKYIIDHVDCGYYPYGRIHVADVKYVKVEEAGDEEEINTEN